MSKANVFRVMVALPLLLIEVSYGSPVKIESDKSDVSTKSGNVTDLPDTSIAMTTDSSGFVTREEYCPDDDFDLVFVVDSSASMQYYWPTIHTFIENIIYGIPEYSHGGARFGLVYFSDHPTVMFYLDQKRTRRDIVTGIHHLKLMNGYSNAAVGLECMNDHVFQADRGDRIEVPNVAMLITDGGSNVRRDETIPEANVAKARGIRIKTVAVTNHSESESDVVELKKIASSPSDFHMMYDVAKIITSLCTLEEYALIDNCTTGYVDLVFVVDSSESINENGVNNWGTILTFLERVTDHFPTIGHFGVHIGLVVYSTRANVEFHLNEYHTKQGIVGAIRSLKFIGGRTNMAEGLEYMNERVFHNFHGDRRKVPNVALLITGGRSTIRVAETIPEADAAKARDIRIIVVGVKNKIDDIELKNISSSLSDFHMVNDFTQLNQLSDETIAILCPTEPTN